MSSGALLGTFVFTVEAAIDFPWLLLIWFVKAFASGLESSRNVFPECGRLVFEIASLELHHNSVSDPDMIVHDHAPQRGAAGGLAVDFSSQEKRHRSTLVFLLQECIGNGVLPIFGLKIIGQKVYFYVGSNSADWSSILSTSGLVVMTL